MDQDGSCIGVLCASDFMHWAREGGIGAEDVPLPACPYQVKGRLLTGQEAMICTLAEGEWPLQTVVPITGGRHTAICRLRRIAPIADWQEVTKTLPTSAVRRYMTANVVTVEGQTPLAELVRTMLDAHIHRVFVVDARRRPIGVVSTTDILGVLAYGGVPAEAVRRCAYQKWEAAGKPFGEAVRFWLEAERELSHAR